MKEIRIQLITNEYLHRVLFLMDLSDKLIQYVRDQFEKNKLPEWWVKKGLRENHYKIVIFLNRVAKLNPELKLEYYIIRRDIITEFVYH